MEGWARLIIKARYRWVADGTYGWLLWVTEAKCGGGHHPMVIESQGQVWDGGIPMKHFVVGHRLF